jgi:hypothetical protein
MLVKRWRARKPRTLFFSNRLMQRPERGSELRAEKLGLFPRREVAAPIDLVLIDDFGTWSRAHPQPPWPVELR